ncbi:cysteine proteinase [Chytriomyces sp. MP71]|nr:cysteine proteinase [Chytriomyces sp. MP71]
MLAQPLAPPATPTATPPSPAPRVTVLGDMLPEIGLEVEEEFTFRWPVDRWAHLARTTKKVYSPEFTCNGAKWRILLFPSGNQQADTLSVFLDSVDAPNMPKDGAWHICVQFALAIVNHRDDSVYRSSTAQHRFNPYEADWGFNHLVKLNQLTIPLDASGRALVEDDQAVFIVHMRVMKDVTGYLWHNFVNYDSKKATGLIGLKNQGATCYMNSLLQALFFIPYFRRATYSIPTDQDEPTKSIPFALQRIFYQLQLSDIPVGTTELTKSFGWDAMDSFMQHDVQEFNRVLQDNLENKMMGTKAEGAISSLFVGKYKSYIKCLDVEFESSRVEDFYDVQLNVKGNKNISDSFRDYISVETLDGENKYHANEYGLQVAKKGVVFTSLPPVLFLQLKRFEYDMERDRMVKINDRYEYAEEINLDQFLEQKPVTPQNYWLYGVLVHSGDLTGGHYCAFLRPEKNEKWFKFDDDRVTPCLKREVFEDNFGGEPLLARTSQQANVTVPRAGKRFTNAYMLIYIRNEDTESIFAPISNADVQEHLRIRFEEERVEYEKKRKEREEQHLYVNTKVLLEDHVLRHRGFDLCNFDHKAYPISPVLQLRLKKETTLRELKETVAKEVCSLSSQLRVWTLVGRQNKTVRPDSVLTLADDLFSLEEIRERFTKASPELRVFVEVVDANAKEEPKTDKSLTIFLKYYDPVTTLIRYAGKIFIPNKSQKISEILPELCSRVSLPPNTPLSLFEEIKPDMVEPLKVRQSFGSAELGDGDIICFQKDVSNFKSQVVDSSGATVKLYFDEMHNRTAILFKPRPDENNANPGPEVEIMLHKKMSYDEVVIKLAEGIHANQSKIRLFTSSGLLSKNHINKTSTTTLQDMLNSGFYNQLVVTSVLFYEVMEVDVTEFETKKYVSVSFIDRNSNELGPFDLFVAKSAHTGDVIKAFRSKVELPAHVPAKAELRLYEVISCKIHKFYAKGDDIGAVNSNSLLVIEELIAEDKLSKGDAHVHVFHFNSHPSRSHGIPFKFALRKGEAFSSTKERLLSKAGLLDVKEASKAKFFIIPSGFAKPIEVVDEDILADKTFGPYDYIGIDHVGRPGKAVKDVNAGKAIKIFG